MASQLYAVNGQRTPAPEAAHLSALKVLLLSIFCLVFVISSGALVELANGPELIEDNTCF